MLGLTQNNATIFIGVMLLLVIGSMYVVRVPRGKVFLVERFGQYRRTLEPGFAFVPPMTNRIAHRLDVERDFGIDFEAPTRSGNLVGDGIGTLKITDPVKACYNVANLDEALNKIAETAFRAAARNKPAADVLAGQATVAAEIRRALVREARALGVEVTALDMEFFEP